MPQLPQTGAITRRRSPDSEDQKWERLTQSLVVRQFQMAFTHATGLPVTLLPASVGNQTSGGHSSEGFCIDGCLGPESGKWCLRTLQGAERKACNSGNSVRFQCPSGLMKILVPVRIGEQHIGNVMVGPFSVNTLDGARLQRLRQRLKKFGLQNEVKRLQVSVNYSPVVPRDKAAAASALVSLFAAYLSESATKLCMERAAHESSLLKQVEACLDELEADEVQSRDIARRLRLSPCHFCKLFKQQTGMTFSQFRILRRVEKACELLLNPRLRINEVAYQSGFGSVPYFVRAFRRHQGCSPTQYRSARAR